MIKCTIVKRVGDREWILDGQSEKMPGLFIFGMEVFQYAVHRDKFAGNLFEGG